MLQRLEGVIFLTAFFAILDLPSGELVYANAGHVPPLHLSSQGEIHKLARTGMPLGVQADSAWETDRISLSPGDSLVLYTDGITDAESASGDFFGEDRLLAAIKGLSGQPAVKIRDALLDQIEIFANDFPQYDDIALLVVHRQGG